MTKRSGIFAQKLKEAIDSKGLKPHAVAVDAGISPPTLYNVLAGRLGPSKTVLDRLAEVKDLGVHRDALQAWADLDELGYGGIDRIKEHASEVLGPPWSPELRDFVAANFELNGFPPQAALDVAYSDWEQGVLDAAARAGFAPGIVATVAFLNLTQEERRPFLELLERLVEEETRMRGRFRYQLAVQGGAKTGRPNNSALPDLTDSFMADDKGARGAQEVDLDSLTGGSRKLTAKERSVVKQILELTNGDLAQVQLGPDAVDEWGLPPGERLEALKDVLAELKAAGHGKEEQRREAAG